MSPPAGKPFVAIIDSKDLRRASITSLLEPWANSESLRLMSFASEPREALQGETDCRMLVYSIGSESVAAISIQARGFIHSGISSALAYHALSFILKGGTYFPRSAFSLPDTPDNSRNAPRNRSESESKSNGHGTNGNGSAHSRSHSGYQPVNLTARQGQILEHVRLGEAALA
jgi:hypothetical protein